ncbi:MAG: phosphoribosylformylglycinamidine synthase, partial [Lentimicrobiaceae bacterium]|nr:phosphoribosylformylglycinamidine synthase [Lentimicrobiaceae bacterium]
MITFFQKDGVVYAVESGCEIGVENEMKLSWLFSDASKVESAEVEGVFIGNRREMVSPWSTNAVEITRNMGLKGITRIEMFVRSEGEADPMLQEVYHNLTQDIFLQKCEPEPIRYIDDLREYTQSEGLALSEEEVCYLESLSHKLKRKLTDSEVFGFSQVNSEHCRHKIFNGDFVIDGQTMPSSLFGLIKKTSKEHPNRLVSAYKDNVAFVEGPAAEQFSPARHDQADFFHTRNIETVLSLKAETHN